MRSSRVSRALLAAVDAMAFPNTESRRPLTKPRFLKPRKLHNCAREKARRLRQKARGLLNFHYQEVTK